MGWFSRIINEDNRSTFSMSLVKYIPTNMSAGHGIAAYPVPTFTQQTQMISEAFKRSSVKDWRLRLNLMARHQRTISCCLHTQIIYILLSKTSTR